MESHKISSISAPHLFVRLAQASKIITYNDFYNDLSWFTDISIYWSTDQLIYLSVCLCLSISIAISESLAHPTSSIYLLHRADGSIEANNLGERGDFCRTPWGGWNFPSLWRLLWNTISSCGLGMGIAMYIQHQLECEPSTMATPAPTSWLELHPTSNLCGNWSKTTIRGQYQPFHLGQLVQWLLN